MVKSNFRSSDAFTSTFETGSKHPLQTFDNL